MKLKTLTHEEFSRLTLEERLQYLDQVMAELREKLDQMRHQVPRPKPPDGE